MLSQGALVLCALLPRSAAILEPTIETGDIDAFQDAYLWILVVGIIGGLFMSWGIGANDVANSFGSSVGSKALTLRQAVVLATVVEFVGCVTMGASVTNTVRKGIIDASYLEANPEVLQLAMLSSLLGAGLWLATCSYLGSPVSTTHSIIGSLIGVSLTVNPESLNWPMVSMVIISWVTSPVLSGIIAALLFLLVRTFILRSPDAVSRGFKFFPVLLFFTFSVVCLYTTFKNPQVDLKSWRKDNPGLAVLAALGVATLLAAITYAATFRLLRSRVETGRQEQTQPESEMTSKSADDKVEEKKAVGRFWDQDLHAQCAEEDAGMVEMHTAAEEFSKDTETLFSFLQVISAGFGGLAHGANDVANAVGPLAAIWGIYKSAEVNSKVEVPIWILVLGGVGISIGLLTYGYNVIKSVGIKLTKITPTRGFTIEMGMSIVVIIGSNLGIPLSTTHCQVGATVGVGMCEIGGFRTVGKGVNWRLMGKVFAMWVLTLVFAGIVSSSIFGFLSAIYHPISAPLHCGPIENMMNTVPNSTFVTSEDMRELFSQLDTDGDDMLSTEELEVEGMDLTLGGDPVVEKYGRRRRRSPSAIDEGDFLKFTCTSSDSLEHMHHNKCEPRCASGLRANAELKCEVSPMQIDASGNYMLATRYTGFTACEGAP